MESQSSKEGEQCDGTGENKKTSDGSNNSSIGVGERETTLVAKEPDVREGSGPALEECAGGGARVEGTPERFAVESRGRTSLPPALAEELRKSRPSLTAATRNQREIARLLHPVRRRPDDPRADVAGLAASGAQPLPSSSSEPSLLNTERGSDPFQAASRGACA